MRTDREASLQKLTPSGSIHDVFKGSNGLGLEGSSVERKEQGTRRKKSCSNLLKPSETHFPHL